MYRYYYVNTNAQSNGDHEVHKDGCSHMPGVLNRKFLGSFTNCRDAVIEAKKLIQQLMAATIVQMNVIVDK